MNDWRDALIDAVLPVLNAQPDGTYATVVHYRGTARPGPATVLRTRHEAARFAEFLAGEWGCRESDGYAVTREHGYYSVWQGHRVMVYERRVEPERTPDRTLAALAAGASV